MLYNLDWLQTGKLFPPKTEVSRLSQYRDNFLLFNGESRKVLKPYEERFLNIIKDFENYNVKNYFMEIPDYWQLSTLKTVDLILGEKPVITADKNKERNKIIDLFSNEQIDFFNRIQEIIIDIDIYGESAVRVYDHKDEITGEKHRDFVIIDPMTWFPVVDRENVKKIKQHIIAWLVCVYSDPNNSLRDRYELNVQIHTVDKDEYITRKYDISEYRATQYTNTETEQLLNYTQYTIGNQIGADVVIKDQIMNNIVLFSGTTTSKSLHGISAYDRVTPIIAELSLRKSLRDYILDKNASPRIAAPESSFVKDKMGSMNLRTGGNAFVVGEGEVMPQYVTWDGNLTSNENAILDLEKDLFAISEMGALIDNSELNSSQGREALRIKLTNAVAKVKRICNKLLLPLKRLIGLLTDFDPNAITINFNAGLPLNENEILNNAILAKNIGLSQKSILTNYFKLEDSEADKEIEQKQTENADNLATQMQFHGLQGANNE
jgi:uncharacterized ubiquitin-like protein YukD